MNNYYNKQKKGITLIELLIILIVFSIVVPALIMVQTNATQKVAQAEKINVATVLGRGLLEEVIGKRFDEADSCDMPCPAPCDCWSAALGPETGETRNQYDDIDDFDGLQESQVADFPDFSRQVEVYYVDPDSQDLDTRLPDDARTNYKRVDITVSHDLLGDIPFSFITSSQY